MCRLVLIPLFALLALVVPSSPASAADPYPPDVPTHCKVTAPSAVVGQRVVLRIVVSANTNLAVTGSVDITVGSWKKTVRYEDSPLRVVGPRLSRGDHVATIRFTPDGNTFIGCEDTTPFEVGGVVDGDVGGQADLPDTGGPHFLLLIAGAVLVLAGAERVAASRRSRA